MADPPIVLAMPGSRSSEVARLAGVFGEALALVAEACRPDRSGGADRAASAGAGHAGGIATWPIKPRIVVEQAEKLAALRVARAALAKSGTTTLELAVAGVPMVAAYKVSRFEAVVIKRLVRVPSFILANLVIGQNVVPELVQDDCTPKRLADALVAAARRHAAAAPPGRSLRQARRHHGDRFARARRPRRRHRARTRSADRAGGALAEREANG